MSTSPIKYYTSLRPKGITLKQVYDFNNQVKSELSREKLILSGQKFLIKEIPSRINYIHNKYYYNETIQKESHYSIDRLFSRFNSICSKFFDLNDNNKLLLKKDIVELDELGGIYL